jgi:hypothetical protein
LKRAFFFCCGLLAHLLILGQHSYWQQETNYTIDVSLNDSSHSLDGFLKLEYINHSPDTISFIWFHLWPNAFKNDRTAFSEQLLQNGRTDFYFSDKEQRGYINRLDFRTNNFTLKTEDHPSYIDVVKVHLLDPLRPGEKIEITTPFHVKIPKNFSRGGRTGRSYQITQWYPKPAMYDRKGWHPMPYLDQGEFYSEFGSFDVRITVPKSYMVASTGELQNPQANNQGPITEVSESKAISLDTQTAKPTVEKQSPRKKAGTSKKTPSKSKAKSTSPSSSTSETQLVSSTTPVEYKTLQYKQSNVHDFAWFADKNFVVKQDTIHLVSGKVVDAYSYYTSRDNKAWQNSIQYVKDAIHFRSAALGEYPYKTVTVVEAKMGFDGGMEYPTITSISGVDDEVTLEETIEHEVGHNWMQGILGTNERVHPWMDEGINSYYDARYNEWKYGKRRRVVDARMSKKFPDNIEQLLVNAYAKHKLDQPISTSSEEFTQLNYFLISYFKTADWMKGLEDILGRNALDSSMKEYFRLWQLRHPYPEDLQALIQSNTEKDLGRNFRALSQKGPAVQQQRKLKPVFLFSFKEADRYDYLNILPGMGYNKYDGFMIGTVLHNYNLPSSRLQFVAVPLYATGSKQLNGTGSIAYSWFPNKIFQRMRLSVSGARFSMLKGVDSTSAEIFGTFNKIATSLRVTLANRSPRSTLEKWIEWKTFLIGERGFNYVEKSADSLFYPSEAPVENRYLNQLTLNVTDYRALYPYDLELQLQQGDGFYRANATAHYFYNYAKGGGMQVRFFAAKFGYIGTKTSSKEFETERYQPKLTAVRGNEDYTYSNYFLGRNESEYFLSQQIMLRDGGLKLRTDLFQGLQGRSDNWVSSLNFNTTLPEKLFPIKIPLRIFFDIGTYAEAWKKDAATSRFLYVAGLQLSLFKNMLNIYAPLIYSSEFRDNLKTVPGENKFFQRLSFSIDIHRFDWRRIVGYKVPI